MILVAACALGVLATACSSSTPPAAPMKSMEHPGYAPSASMLGSAETIRSFRMLSARDGWVLTSQRLMLTADGGGSWEDRTPPGVRSFQEQVAAGFSDPRNGLIAEIAPGRYGRASVVHVFRTTDGGIRWHR